MYKLAQSPWLKNLENALMMEVNTQLYSTQFDLSNAFDRLLHDLLIAKFHGYGFDTPSLKLLHSYLTERYWRVKINNSFSEYHFIKYGVPQGSILGPILFTFYVTSSQLSMIQILLLTRMTTHLIVLVIFEMT